MGISPWLGLWGPYCYRSSPLRALQGVKTAVLFFIKILHETYQVPIGYHEEEKKKKKNEYKHLEKLNEMPNTGHFISFHFSKCLSL
jgi:hypothetical protein